MRCEDGYKMRPRGGEEYYAAPEKGWWKILNSSSRGRHGNSVKFLVGYIGVNERIGWPSSGSR
jgi:hypothetical protein